MRGTCLQGPRIIESRLLSTGLSWGPCSCNLYASEYPRSTRSHILSRLLKCPAEQFQGIVHAGGGTILHPKDRPSQNFPDGVYRLRFHTRQIRPRPHPPDEYTAPPDPGAIEPCLAISGPINRKSLDCRRFNRHDWTRKGLLAPENRLVRMLEPSIVGGLG